MSQFRRFLAATLVVSMTAAGLPLPAQAAMLATDTAIGSTSAARDHITTLVDRADVRKQLEALGVNPADVKARINALSDDEAAQLAARIDQLPAGADAAGALVGALVLIFIVLLITDILGVTHVFPFTRPISR